MDTNKITELIENAMGDLTEGASGEQKHMAYSVIDGKFYVWVAVALAGPNVEGSKFVEKAKQMYEFVDGSGRHGMGSMTASSVRVNYSRRYPHLLIFSQEHEPVFSNQKLTPEILEKFVERAKKYGYKDIDLKKYDVGR